MSPLLRGAGETSSVGIKTLKEFLDSLANPKNITPEEKRKFADAFKFQVQKDNENAKKLYEELLKKYKNNKVIKHNLFLLNKK